MRSCSIIVRRWRKSENAPRVFVVSVLVLYACGNVATMNCEAIADRATGQMGELITAGIVGMMYGLIVSQVVFHSIWSVLSTGAGIWRLLVSGIAACFLYLSFVCAQMSQDRYYELQYMLFGLLALPAIMIACQTPLWILRAGWRWQISKVDNREHRRQHKPMTIAGLFMATAAVGVAITCVRIGVQLEVLDMDFVSVCLVFFPIASLLAGIPTLFFVLWMRKFYWGWLCSFTLIAALLLGYVMVIISFLDTNRSGGAPDPIMWLNVTGVCVGFVVACACFLSTPLLVARWLGLRMQRG